MEPVEALHALGEHLGAGHLEAAGAPAVVRAARALRRHCERAPLPEWRGEPLYPSGPARLPAGDGCAVSFSYTAGIVCDRTLLAEKRRQAGDGPVGAALDALAGDMDRLYACGSAIPPHYSLGGRGYTHSILNYGRIVREGLTGYRARAAAGRQAAQEPERRAFYDAMLDLLEGIGALCRRVREQVGPVGGELSAALARVPARPARTFYEALVAANLLWYLDGCDNFGRLDQDLGPLLDADLAAGRISRGEAVRLIRLLWANVDANNGWNVALGGSTPDGEPAYNALTEVCLEAAAGRRRPNLALRVREDMPDGVFERALDAIATGCGLPALYNEEGYVRALAEIAPGIGGDRYAFAFGGCTETMLHGCSNVGSIDAGLNLLRVLAGSLRQRLPAAGTFEELLAGFLEDARAEIRALAAGVNRDQELKARFQPQPIRSLFVDDCLERGLDFNAGGARYNTGVVNVGGLANVADSLAAVEALVFAGGVPAGELLAALDADFRNHEALLARAQACPKFGNDDDRVDRLAARVAGEVFAEIRRHRCWRGGVPFEPACILFVTYAGAGEEVGATPDGRRAGAPIGDSVGPVQGRDTHGPTAMLRSAAKLPLGQAAGTPILNLRLAPELFAGREGREKVKAMLRSYFRMGGMQIQVTVVDQEVLRDALAHPERHGDLIVRIGGYSEYFNRLSPALQRSVLERVEHRG